MTVDLYLEVDIDRENGVSSMSVSSIIVLFVGKFCGLSSDRFHLTRGVKSSVDRAKTIDIKVDVLIGMNVIETTEDIPYYVRHCSLPAGVSHNGRMVHSGLCSILRLIIKTTGGAAYLLGLKQNCLKTCAEVSTWTNFCEVHMPTSIEKFLSNVVNAGGTLELNALPKELFQLESHFLQPPVVSNISKRKSEIHKKKQFSGSTKTLIQDASVAKSEKTCTGPDDIVLPHLFVEGLDFVLTDLVLVPCVTLILSKLTKDLDFIRPHLKRVFEWYERALSVPSVKEALAASGLPVLSVTLEKTVDGHIDNSCGGKKVELIRDPDKKKIKSTQKNVSEVLTRLNVMGLQIEMEPHPVVDISIDWQQLPSFIHPKDGNLPVKRIERKCQQLENLAAAVRHLARPNDTIIDFCSGGGHLGLLIAYLLPNCNIVLVENKEESILRAIFHMESLGLTNVNIFQSNLDYVNIPFDVGICLHGCGVATDLVLEKCLVQSASFVVCPCCYGAIQQTRTTSYPQSIKFKESGISYMDFLLLVHTADQTQMNICQIEQGKTSMIFVDSDRLNRAQECGYETHLCTLLPPTCSPKNHLLIGISPNRTID